MIWWLAALLGAIVWGVHYTMITFALRQLSIMSVLILTTAPMIIISPFFYKVLYEDFKIFNTLELINKLQILSISITSIVASALIYYAINSKNATLASLIEISYPIFVVMFSYLIFKENYLNNSILIGGLLIFVGVGIIISNN